MADTLKQVNATITSAAGQALINGTTNTTYTILSISLCNTHDTNDETFQMFRTDGGASTGKAYIYKNQSLPALSTFIHNDKLVLEAEDEVWVGIPGGGATVDVVVSYLEQT